MKSMDEKYSLFCVIANFGKGSKILERAKELGATGGTLFLGRGTVDSLLLKILGLDEIRREILMMVIEKKLEDIFHAKLTEIFSFNKPNHGIAFSIPVKKFIRNKESKYIANPGKGGEGSVGYEAIVTIVDKGLSEEVLDAAKSAGSTGGTVIHGRGSGCHETAKLFNIHIEPEKDIVLILSSAAKTEKIVNAIREKLNIDEPGAGIIFVLDVNRTSGLLEK